MARDASVAVLLRRGPTDWVELIRWTTSNDTFERGQWFHGRVYERRCDLSPSGELFVYFAAKHNPKQFESDYTYAWTALSRPPYFTALSLWPKGDCWDGGGWFEADRRLHLNHCGEPRPYPKYPVHKKLRVETNRCGRGEDLPIYNDILQAKGWTLQTGDSPWRRDARDAPPLRALDPVKKCWSRSQAGLTLRMELEDIDVQKPGGPYHFGFLVMRESDQQWLQVLDAQWVDWDQRGRLVYAQDGKLYAAKPQGERLAFTELADFTTDQPREMSPTHQARQWPRW